jgi:inosine-uridine nucleoside N-ribohydrolase/formylmethanofuran dehydrogenase subunit E
MMKRILCLLAGLSITILLSSHPWKPSHYVIIDTDGGIDDMRAITLMLASPDIRVLAITVSPGVLNSNDVYLKVKSLLNSFHHEGIPVGINRSAAFKSPEYKVALNAKWGEEGNLDPASAPDCTSLIKEILSDEKTKISFICIGGMSTAYNALKDGPLFRQQVKEILWSVAGTDDARGFNYNIDPSSAKKILKEDVPVYLVGSFTDSLFFDENLIKDISEVKTQYAEKLTAYFNSDIARGHSFSYRVTDEMVPLFLQFPSIFKADSTEKNIVYSCSGKNLLSDDLLKMLKGETVPRNQVIKDFPLDPSFYFDDIKSSVSEILTRYGIDEWTSGVLANELHRHLGVFAIIGVKMGIRAREYFDTGVDEFTVTSFAGSNPPLSCMNDGLQVGTGATPGHGLLTVRNDTVLSPSAQFTYLNRRIRLTLKPEIASKISSELKEINFVYGLDSDIYWELVRKNTIKYWKDLDREQIFIINEIY